MLSLGKESVLTNANGDIGKADCYCTGKLLSMYKPCTGNKQSFIFVRAPARTVCVSFSLEHTPSGYSSFSE